MKLSKPCGTEAGHNRAVHRRLRGAEHCGPCEPCKQAHREAVMAWAKANPEKKKAYQDGYRARPGMKEANKNRMLKWLHGITLEDYNRILLSQNGCCDICKEILSADPNHRHLDHDHLTKKVRGILCHRCNALLGFAEDSIEKLEQSIVYLREYGSLKP